MTWYVFDVDGTLTPSRGRIDTNFSDWFEAFVRENSVCLVTGSDREKTIEQLGSTIVDSVEYCFNCAGNAIYKNGQLIHQSNWVLPDEPWNFLENYLYKQSPYAFRYGKHFEQRIGLLNFSVVGRNAKGVQRSDYFEWDQKQKEREYLVRQINTRWPDLQAAAGGETGIDIFARGCDKAQIIKYLLPIESRIFFFGDRIDPEGNDYTLAQEIQRQNRGMSFCVSDWSHTWNLLQTLTKTE